MNELELKYGCNPNQKPARIFMKDGSDLPVTVLNGRPGYINFLDAFNSWQLVRELKAATGLPSAASFKHVSPAGAAVAHPLTDIDRRMYFVDNVPADYELSPIATAYIRARGADYVCAPIECKDVFGVTFEQGHNDFTITPDQLNNVVTQNKELTDQAKIDMVVAQITLKYTQSNSVCYVKDGLTIGVGAGQQSRIHCTRLAGNKADNWYLRQHPKVLGLKFVEDIRRPNRDNAIDVYTSDEYEDVLADGEWQKWFTERPEPLTLAEKKEWIAQQSDVTLGSDAFFPFGDNVERAHKSGVKYIVEPGGSMRDDDVIETADKYGIAIAFTGMRLFHH